MNKQASILSLAVCVFGLLDCPAYSADISDLPEMQFSNLNFSQDVSNPAFVSYTTPFAAINDIKIDGKDVWIAQMSSVLRYNTETRQWQVYTRSDGLDYDQLYRIWITPEYVYAIAHYNRKAANRYDKSTGKWEVLNFSDLQKTDFPMSTSDIGENLLAKARGLIYRQGTDFPIAADDENVWVGADGLCRYYKKRQVWNCWRSEASLDNVVTSMAKVAPNEVYFGTKNGLIRLDAKNGKWFRHTVDDGLPDNDVLSLAVGNGGVYASFSSGLARLNPADNTWSSIGEVRDAIISLAEENRLWLLTPDGLKVFDVSKEEWSDITLPVEFLKTKVTGVVKLGSKIWIGTGTGLYSYSLGLNTWGKLVVDNGQMKNADTVAITKVQNSNTKYRREYLTHVGLIKTDGDRLVLDVARWPVCADGCGEDGPIEKHLLVYDPKNGMSSDFSFSQTINRNGVKNIIPTEKYLWYVGGMEVRRIDKKNGDVRAYTCKDLYNPFLPTQANCIGELNGLALIDDSTLWLGSRNGVSAYTERNGWRAFSAPGMGTGAANIQVHDKQIWAQAGYWVAYIASPWSKYDVTTGRWLSYINMQTWQPIQHSLIVKNDWLWYSTNNSVEAINLVDGRRKKFEADVVVNNVVPGKYLWALTKTDLRRWDQSQKQWEKFPYDVKNIQENAYFPGGDSNLRMIENQGYVWIGHSKGLARFNISKQTFEYLNQTVSSANILGLFPVKNAVWAVSGMQKTYVFSAGTAQLLKYTDGWHHGGNLAESPEYIAISREDGKLLLIDKNRETERVISKIGHIAYPAGGTLAFQGDSYWAGMLKINLNWLLANNVEKPIPWIVAGKSTAK